MIKNNENGKKAQGISPKIRSETGSPLSLLLFNMVLDVTASIPRKSKEMKGIQRAKEEVTVSLSANDMII